MVGEYKRPSVSVWVMLSLAYWSIVAASSGASYYLAETSQRGLQGPERIGMAPPCSFGVEICDPWRRKWRNPRILFRRDIEVTAEGVILRRTWRSQLGPVWPMLRTFVTGASAYAVLLLVLTASRWLGRRLVRGQVQDCVQSEVETSRRSFPGRRG